MSSSRNPVHPRPIFASLPRRFPSYCSGVAPINRTTLKRRSDVQRFRHQVRADSVEEHGPPDRFRFQHFAKASTIALLQQLHLPGIDSLVLRILRKPFCLLIEFTFNGMEMRHFSGASPRSITRDMSTERSNGSTGVDRANALAKEGTDETRAAGATAGQPRRTAPSTPRSPRAAA